MNNKSALIISTALVLGLSIGSWILSSGIKQFHKEDRIISVKGFSEHEVKADLAVWSLQVRVASNNLSEGSTQIESGKTKVIQFLMKNGITADEISQKDLQVQDKKANDYEPANNPTMLRYVVTKTIQVRSTNVDNILKVSRMTDELLRAGVAISSANAWQGGGPRFLFTKLNDIKPAMLAEATRNAKNAALEFSNESNTSLGKLRKANQGLFSIADRDEVSAVQGETGSAAGTNDLYKKVRVVISVDYSIE